MSALWILLSFKSSQSIYLESICIWWVCCAPCPQSSRACRCRRSRLRRATWRRRTQCRNSGTADRTSKSRVASELKEKLNGAVMITSTYLLVPVENTHCMGKYHYTAGLQFDCIVFHEQRNAVICVYWIKTSQTGDQLYNDTSPIRWGFSGSYL